RAGALVRGRLPPGAGEPHHARYDDPGQEQEADDAELGGHLQAEIVRIELDRMEDGEGAGAEPEEGVGREGVRRARPQVVAAVRPDAAAAADEEREGAADTLAGHELGDEDRRRQPAERDEQGSPAGGRIAQKEREQHDQPDDEAEYRPAGA